VSVLKSENLSYLIEARADQLLRDNGALMKKLADTGCMQVFIGAESASQETLNYMRKGTKAEDYYRLMKLAAECKVALRMSFIVGFPGERDESVGETLDLCEAIENGDFGAWINVSGPKIFTPYPGTLEFDRSIDSGFPAPTTNAEWGMINRSTVEYLRYFPWLERNLSHPTLRRLEKYFGKGHEALVAH